MMRVNKEANKRHIGRHEQGCGLETIPSNIACTTEIEPRPVATHSHTIHKPHIPTSSNKQAIFLVRNDPNHITITTTTTADQTQVDH